MKRTAAIGIAIALAGVVALANFSRPPIGVSSSGNLAMWQVYSSIVERVISQCGTYSNPPASSMNTWRLAQYKSKLSNMLATQCWINPTNVPVRMDEWTALDAAGLSHDYWTNNPSSMLAYEIPKWTQLVAKVIWSATNATVGDCGTTTNSQLEGWCNSIATCTVENADSIWTNFVSSSSNFPIGEARHWSGSVGTTYQGYALSIGYLASCVDTFSDATNYVATSNVWDASYGQVVGCVDTPTNYWHGCSIPATNRVWDFDDGDCNDFAFCDGWFVFFVETTYHVTNTITNACDALWECDTPTFKLWNHAAALNFATCSNNIAFTGEVWAAASAPDLCFPTSFTNDFGLTNGWNVLQTGVTSNSLCYTNFAKYRVPWSGDTSTNAMGWQVTNALLVQKWNFEYR